jgi:hypothetical protein
MSMNFPICEDSMWLVYNVQPADKSAKILEYSPSLNVLSFFFPKDPAEVLLKSFVSGVNNNSNSCRQCIYTLDRIELDQAICLLLYLLNSPLWAASWCSQGILRVGRWYSQRTCTRGDIVDLS